MVTNQTTLILKYFFPELLQTFLNKYTIVMMGFFCQKKQRIIILRPQKRQKQHP
jgi:hypothetical protein